MRHDTVLRHDLIMELLLALVMVVVLFVAPAVAIGLMLAEAYITAREGRPVCWTAVIVAAVGSGFLSVCMNSLALYTLTLVTLCGWALACLLGMLARNRQLKRSV
jgi:hypothetical protein